MLTPTYSLVNEGINQKHISFPQTHSCPALLPFCILQRHVTPSDSTWHPVIICPTCPYTSTYTITSTYTSTCVWKLHMSTQTLTYPSTSTSTHTHTHTHKTTHVTHTDSRVRHYGTNPSTSLPLLILLGVSWSFFNANCWFLLQKYMFLYYIYHYIDI